MKAHGSIADRFHKLVPNDISMHHLSEQLTSLGESATVALADRVRSLRDSGRDVIRLQTGDPDFSTPRPIVDRALRAIEEGQTHYCESRGLPVMRRAIAEKLRRVNNVEYDPASEVLVTCGGIHAYYCALRAILNPGDEVVVPNPCWMPHRNIVEMLGGKAVAAIGRAENRFWPTLEAWSTALSPRTVALVINSPNNPTGSVASREYLEAINQLAADHQLYVISDEVYENILFDGHKHTCFASLPQAKQRTLLVNSLSKTYAMTGWRVGYLAAPSSVIEAALKASQYSITNLAPFIQYAAAFALTDDRVAQEAEQMVAAYARRRALVVRLWRDRGKALLDVTEPQGAIYIFLDLRPLRKPSTEIAERVLQDIGVALVPGSAFGTCGEGFLRMTIAAADADIENGFRALLDWIQRQ